jgi:cephalosporin-C deacetylase-like acetyl esterase
VEGYPVEHVFFLSAPDIVVTGAMVHPRTAAPATRTDLVLFGRGTNAIPEQRSFIEGLLREGRRVFVFDPRGIGAVETRPVNPRGLKDNYGTEYKLGCDALMLGISTLGLRVFDALRGLDYLKGRADAGRIGVHGVGFGGLLAYLAGALDDGWADVTVEDAFTSYREVAETRYYTRGFGMREVAWGVLRRFDLVDLLPCLAPRPLRFIAPRDAYGRRVPAETFRAGFLDVAREAGYLRDGWMPSVE